MTISAEQQERFAAVIEAIDVAAAARPDIIASPMGFVVGALIGAGRSDLAGTYDQLAGFADVLAYVVAYVNGHPEASLDRIVASILPAPESQPVA